MTTNKHPIQPLVTDDHGVLRFKENPIVCDLLDFATDHGFDLNEIASREYSREDQQQLAQLIGYSLHRYGDLQSYVDNDAYGAAQLMASGLDERAARIEHLQSTINALRAALVEPMAELFGVHPDDLSANLPEEPSHDNQSALVGALEELIDLMEDTRHGEYVPDSFTTQPARIALAAYRKQEEK